jgi:hypothetical protein
MLLIALWWRALMIALVLAWLYVIYPSLYP